MHEVLEKHETSITKEGIVHEVDDPFSVKTVFLLKVPGKVTSEFLQSQVSPEKPVRMNCLSKTCGHRDVHRPMSLSAFALRLL